jgi:hypothetical protein
MEVPFLGLIAICVSWMMLGISIMWLRQLKRKKADPNPMGS